MNFQQNLRKLIALKYLRPRMNYKINQWCWVFCQTSKLSRHNRSKNGRYVIQTGCFDHIQMYIQMTFIDRFMKKIEAVLLRDNNLIIFDFLELREGIRLSLTPPYTGFCTEIT